MKRKAESLAAALSHWTQAETLQIDPELTKLLHSGFFNSFQRLTGQMLFLVDNSRMKYLYVSDNCSEIMGYSPELLRNEGLHHFFPLFHPGDLQPLDQISALLTNKALTIPPDQLVNCRLSFDYRMRFADNQYHRLLQHNLPVTVDKQNRIGHALAVISDITPFKKENHCSYQLAHYQGSKRSVLLQGSIGDGKQEPGSYAEITPREQQMIELTAKGLKEAEVATRMRIGIQTVKTHKRNLFRKTGCRNAAELVRYAAARMLI